MCNAVMYMMTQARAQIQTTLLGFCALAFKVYTYMTYFFYLLDQIPQGTDKYSKKVFSVAIFLSRVLMYQKHQISLPVGYKTARPKTGDWERL